MIRPSEEVKKYIGKQEIRGNKGFLDPVFQAEMIEEKWLPGYAWCMVLCRVVYVNCFPEKSVELRKLFVPGVVNTFKNLVKAAYPVNHLPQIDDLVCWQQMKDGIATGLGHAGICTSLIWGPKTPPNGAQISGFKSVEGNTTAKPGEREGYIVAEHSHNIGEPVQNGLQLLGFVHITKPINLILNV